MATTRSQIPVTNLKERIAALEQRNAGINATPRPTSPTPSTLPANGATAPGFRDKIAKFERKGGIPVPRGSFGLGAPPVADGPRRRGELYGNRIPAPARAFSGGILPDASRAGSPTPTDATGVGSPGPSPTSGAGDRRSFSLSSVMSDDTNDYTPISSPTFAFPPDSPESDLSIGHTPETSPTLTSVGDVPVFNKPIVRGTSFQKAMEIARNAEIAKLENGDPILPTQQDSSDKTGSKYSGAEAVPSIIVSSDGPVATPPATFEKSLALPMDAISEAQPVPKPKSLEADLIVEPIQKELPILDPKQEVVEPEVPPPVILVIPLTTPSPEYVAETELQDKLPVLADIAPIVVVHAPPPLSEVAEEHSIVEQHKTPTVVIHAPKVASAPLDATPTVVIHEASPVKPIISAPSTISEPETQPSHSKSVPEVGAHQEMKEATSSAKLSSRKAALTLDSELLNEDSFTSPLETGNTSAMSLTDMLGDYFKQNADGTFRPTTPPSKPLASPMSPYATLAYDGPETPGKESQGKPATIDVPDPQAFLSPPTTGFRASGPSSGSSSLGSLSSLGSRPVSMIESGSAPQVSRAMRMTPATGRGVPMFFPPTSAATRKSDFVYFPPTPVKDEFAPAVGSATIHKATQSMSLERAATFTAVVHDKVRQPTAAASVGGDQRRVPETPQMKRVKRMTVMEPPSSPGNGELAALLQEAMLLENSLDRGELPTEAWVRLDAEESQRKEEEVIAAAQAEARKTAQEERQRIAAAAARLQAKRDEPMSGRLKHTFLVPLSKARSAHRKEVSAPEPPPKSQDDQIARPKSAGIPEKSAALPSAKSHISQNGQIQRPTTPEDNSQMQQQQLLETPPKSAKTSRFAGFRRLGSMSARPTTIHGHSTRTSVSTMSSDSTAVLTPPEGTLEFAASRQPSVNEFGGLSANGSTTSFPSLSPKKSSTSIGRAASFAERVFSRTRTKSSASNLSIASEMTDRIPEDVPTLPSISIGAFTSNLDPIPATPAIVLPVSGSETRVIHPPKRSASLARSSRLPPLPAEVVPPLPVITPSAFFSTAAEASGFGGSSLIPPLTDDTTRPVSWTSMSSAGSLPSPLFDKAIFDAFPSVPEMTPALPAIRSSVHQRSIETTISYERPSFDSDLLSSAIHLANTRKSTAPIVAPSLGPNGRATTPAPRRSGESAR